MAENLIMLSLPVVTNCRRSGRVVWAPIRSLYLYELLEFVWWSWSGEEGISSSYTQDSNKNMA